jgi:hypothetical protein
MAVRKAGFGIVLLVAILGASCGYRIRGSVGRLPSGIQSLGIPTFRNSTNQYKIEQIISIAVLKEFSIRTRIPVNSSSSGVDAVLLGEIFNVSSVPATFGSQTFGSAFLLTVQMRVKLVKLKDSTIIWQKDGFLYRERYVLNSNVKDFFSEENPALERLALDFAASLASTILENRKP